MSDKQPLLKENSNSSADSHDADSGKRRNSSKLIFSSSSDWCPCLSRKKGNSSYEELNDSTENTINDKPVGILQLVSIFQIYNSYFITSTPFCIVSICRST